MIYHLPLHFRSSASSPGEAGHRIYQRAERVCPDTPSPWPKGVSVPEGNTAYQAATPKFIAKVCCAWYVIQHWARYNHTTNLITVTSRLKCALGIFKETACVSSYVVATLSQVTITLPWMKRMKWKCYQCICTFSLSKVVEFIRCETWA